MVTVAVINGYERNKGSTVAALSYFNALESLGYQTRWYQCMDKNDPMAYILGEKNVTGIGLPIKSMSMLLNRTFLFPNKLKGMKEDIILISDPVFLDVSKYYRNSIVIVHDLRELTKFKTNLGGYLLFKHLLPRLRRVKRIIASSTYTKTQLVSYGIEEERISVVPLSTEIVGTGYSHIERSLSKLENGADINVLYVAVDRPYKNVDLFIRIANEIRKIDTRLKYRFHLVSELRAQNKRLISELGATNITVHEKVVDISTIYELSDILVFTSEFEGFGMPLIESMQFGLPIIAHNIPPINEVVGDSGVLVDHSNVIAWVNWLCRFQDPSFYAEYANRSINRSEYFKRNALASRIRNVLENF